MKRATAGDGTPSTTGRRRSLSHSGGPVRTRGDPEMARSLGEALAAASHHEARAHVHGFHSYPARMHPAVAQRAIRAFAPNASTVLDPFCGCGTVLVEACLAGRLAVGVDINPLAVLLSRFKTRRPSEIDLTDLLASSCRIEEQAHERRRTRAGATCRYPQADTLLFDPHVLLELDSLRHGVFQLRDGYARDGLMLVLSSILTKLSRQPGDTSDRRVERRLAAGFAARLFAAKTRELVGRIRGFVRRLDPRTPLPRVEQGDARRLRHIASQSVALVLTSPPYVGTYDYLSHHATRLRWLGLDASLLETEEIGARRHAVDRDGTALLREYEKHMVRSLRGIRRVLREDGRAVLVVGDSVVAGRAVEAESLMIGAASAAGLEWIATASQPRPTFQPPRTPKTGRVPRSEHLMGFRVRAQVQS